MTQNNSLDILLEGTEKEVTNALNLMDLVEHTFEEYKKEELFVNEEYIIRYKNLVKKITEHYKLKLCSGKCSTKSSKE